MIVTLIGMNAIVLIGFFKKTKTTQPAFSFTQPSLQIPPPVITIRTDTAELAAGNAAGLTWEVAGAVTSCTASGDWSGVKTPFGSESTGRIQSEGTKSYTLTCENSQGQKGSGTATLAVKPAVIASPPSLGTSTAPASGANAPKTPTTSTPAPVAATPVYCDGALPCYGPREIATHGSGGNCWGWNGNRVLNVTTFDSAYHKALTGISTIEVSGICGKNLASSLAGGVPAGGQTHDHKATTKSNADRNMIIYFVGYFDNNKP